MLATFTAGCDRDGASAPLAERAPRYWELKQGKRWEEIYDQYLDPTLKETVKKETFLRKRRLAFDVMSFTIAEARENEDEGTVKAEVEANIPLRKPGGGVQMHPQSVTVHDQWVKRDGIWYIRLTE